MKKTFLFILSFLFLVSLVWGDVFMTELADPNNDNLARYIELHNNGGSEVDFTEGSGWRINKYTNGSATVSSFIDLTGSIAAGGFYLLSNNGTNFLAVYGFAPDYDDASTDGTAGSNGDDTLELLDGTGTVVDFYGVQPHDDLTSTVWEFEDGRAERANGATSGTNPPVDADWNTWSDGSGGDIVDPQDAPGDFDPGSWIGTGDPLITVTPSSLTGFSYIFGSGPSSEQSFTVEGSDLTANISITAPTNYEISETSGSGYTSPIILTQSGGIVASTTIYTRLKAGLSAGDYDEDITLSSTGATNKTVSCSGAVEAPATTTIPYSEIFATDLGDCYTYSVSGATKEWIWDGGSAYMSGYNSGDTEEDWLVIPGINFDNYSGEVLLFDTSYNYGSDDANNYLKLYYSTNYTGIGDPTSSTWTEISFTHPSTNNTWTSSGILDLSAISGTSVYVAFKYHYEAGSYRNWDVDNISITEVAGPSITNVISSPSSPTSSQTVSVSADVTDADGISSVELHWGTTSGSLGTTITMSNGGSGDTYTTTSDIPAQSDGTTVYYEVYAVDNNANPTTSGEFSYLVSDAVGPTLGDLIITEICGDGVDGDNGNDNGFMEIFNTSSNTLSLANIQARYYNSNPGNPTQTISLSGTIAPGAYIIVAQNETNFNTTYAPITADFIGSAFYFNGGDDGVDIYDTTSDAEILDSFNDNGTGASPWTWSANNVFERTSTGDGATVTNWTENTTGLGTPGADNENPLPVTLSDFSAAIIMNEFVQVSWTTQSESSINVWNLYRETDDSMGQILLNSQPGTNTTQPNTYIFEDHEVEEDITYYYYLEVIEYDGSSNMWGPISAILEGTSIPDLLTTMLESNYPNPFNPSTTIKCDIKEGEEGEFTIYNSRGQVIERQMLNAGEHIIEWDGTPYGSGVYLYKLETNSYTKTRKMIMIK